MGLHHGEELVLEHLQGASEMKYWEAACAEGGASPGPDCVSVACRAVGATSSTAGKMAPGAAPSTSARRCKGSARPQTSSTATSSCSALRAMP